MVMILRWVIFALAIMFTAWIVPGITVENFTAGLIMAIVIGLVNTFIKPILSFITMPVNILTLGLFGVILNALMLMLSGYIAPGVNVSGFLPALIGSIILAVLGGFIFKIPERS